MTNNLKAERTLTAEELQGLFPKGVPVVAMKVLFPEKSAPLTTEEVRLVLQSLSTQQHMGEPVAWMHPTAGWARKKYHSVLVHCRKDGPKPIPLYALHPNQESGE